MIAPFCITVIAVVCDGSESIGSSGNVIGGTGRRQTILMLLRFNCNCSSGGSGGSEASFFSYIPSETEGFTFSLTSTYLIQFSRSNTGISTTLILMSSFHW
eukprot:215238_1